MERRTQSNWCNPDNPKGKILQSLRSIPTYRSPRFFFAALLVLALTPLLLLPSVTGISRSIHDWIQFQNGRLFGYIAHFTSYSVVTMLVLLVLRPMRIKSISAIVGVLIVHGIATECAQIWIPGRDWDPFDLACNVTSVTITAIVWITMLVPMLKKRQVKP